jgi:hypothetical protein
VPSREVAWSGCCKVGKAGGAKEEIRGGPCGWANWCRQWVGHVTASFCSDVQRQLPLLGVLGPRRIARDGGHRQVLLEHQKTGTSDMTGCCPEMESVAARHLDAPWRGAMENLSVCSVCVHAATVLCCVVSCARQNDSSWRANAHDQASMRACGHLYRAYKKTRTVLCSMTVQYGTVRTVRTVRTTV